MKKQELIHLHGLLAEVREHHEAESGAPLDCEAYEDFGVQPTSIHKSKTDHKAAVFALATGITNGIDEAETETVPAAAD